MTKKDFELIASTIAALNFTPSNKQHIARSFADKLAATNPRFNAERFIEACK